MIIIVFSSKGESMDIQRALVIDTEPILKKLMTTRLNSLGYEVETAPSGLAALALGNRLDTMNLVVCSYHLRGEAQLNSILQLRARLSETTPIIGTSTNPDILSQVLQDGFIDAILPQPTDMTKFREIIQRAADVRISRNGNGR